MDKTIAQYKEMSQLQEFATSQQKIIIQLSKKIQKIEEERDHLKSLLESSVPLIKKEGESLGEKFLTSAEEAICVMQLEKLRDVSASRELTLEETRKVEVFSKVLNAVRNAPKTIEIKNKQISSEELLALVESDDNGKTK
jgi:hypothetical protein